MKIHLCAIAALLTIAAAAFAQQHSHPFVQVSSEAKVVDFDGLVAIEKTRTIGEKSAGALTFSEKDIRLVIATGPEDDMLSYRIQGIRNPTLSVPEGATLRIFFVNKDSDMTHDVRFGAQANDFGPEPSIEMTAGSRRTDPMLGDGRMNGEEIVIKAVSAGVFKYFCSVRGHAKGGMWGTIAVSVPAPGGPPAKSGHVHDMGDASEMKMPGMKMPADAKPHDMKGMDHGGMTMSSVTNIGDPMARESSGTSWAPDSSPMYAYMRHYKDGGMLMLMGSAFVRYTSVGSSRDVSAAGKGGNSRFDAPNMFMAMYSRPVGKKGQIGLRLMASLDPLTERGYGYPLLYQSGEQFHGLPLHDRQHPHDLFAELGFSYSYKFDSKRSVYIYAGLPGEPAIGPPTFMHRISASNDPDAPIGHHWQDATHVTWGVITAGMSFGKIKVEASAFNGREPDENRWAFDRPRLDSFSGRISWNPTRDLALQFSHAYVRSPERSEPDLRIQRKTTASLIYNKAFSKDKNWASTFVWGQNYGNGERTNAILGETNFDFGLNAVFGRFETVEKSGHELVLDAPFEHDIFRVNSLSAGYVRDIYRGKGIDVGLGGKLTLNTNPSALTSVYGGTTHGGWQVFMRIRPSKM